MGGKVIYMQKDENEPVKKGELLAKIDPKDFLKTKEALLHKIEALQEKIEALKLKKRRVKKSLALQTDITKDKIVAAQKAIEAKSALLQAQKTYLQKLKKDEKRYKTLLAKKLIAKEHYENIHTKRVALTKKIEAMQKEIEALRVQKQEAIKRGEIAKNRQKEIFELAKIVASSQKKLQAIKSRLEAINLKLSYTKLYAPFDGVVAKKFFDAPKVIKKGTPVYAIVDPTKLYCEVLLSEKKLFGVKPGNLVTIKVDAIPDKTYEGIVESIAPTSAATFSLVPRDIASGEFTKLDQRFKVRIKLKNIENLRAGMGATVAIKRSN